MTDRPTSGVTPHLTIGGRRAADAIAFYERAFGAEQRGERLIADDGERIMFASLAINGAFVMLNDAFPEYGGPDGGSGGATLHLQVDDADRWFERATGAGATVRMPLADQFWGDRYGVVEDPFGYRWSIGGPVR